MERKIKMQWKPTLRYLGSFAAYYVACLVCGMLFIAMELRFKPNLEGVEFSRSDKTISKSFKPNELVGSWLCLFISGCVPLLVITGYCLYGRSFLRNYKKSSEVSETLLLLHASVLALFVVLTLNGLITGFFKAYLSNPRPDFIARCQPDPARTDGVFVIGDCKQQDTYTLYDGLRSTPSGHSSFVLAGLGYLYMWQAKFTAGSSKRHIWCLLLAALVMVSRVLDHKHRWSDVMYGSLVGLASLGLGWTQVVKPHLLASNAWQLPRPVTQT